MEKNHNTNLI